MLMVKSCPLYEEWRPRGRELEMFRPFFAAYRELFVDRFVKEVRQKGRLPGIKVRVVLPLVAQLYRHLHDFGAPAPENLLAGLKKLERLDVEPDRLMQRLLTTLTLRYIDDYKDDPELMKHLSLLTGYFDGVVRCLQRHLHGTVSRPLGYTPIRGEEVRAMLEPGRSVRLFTLYKGMPIRFKGVVKKVTDGVAEFLVPIQKAAAAEWDRQLVLYDSEDDETVVTSRVAAIRYEGGHAVVTVDGFARVENFLGRRRSVRIAVDRPIKAKLKAQNKLLELEMIDLSVDGVCLEGTSVGGLPTFEQVQVELPLPLADGRIRTLSLQGELRYISKPDRLRRRYHLRLRHNPQKEQIIASYVARRELELLKEIKELATRHARERS